MTIPLLPPVKNTDDVIDDTYVDAVRAHLDYWGGNRPSVICYATENFRDAPNNTTELLLDFYDAGIMTDTVYGAETWTPITGYNAGGWYVPVDGRYDLNIRLSWAVTSLTGRRQVGYRVNGGSAKWLGSSSGVARIGVEGTALGIELDEDDELAFICYHNGGTDIEILSGYWSATLAGEQ